MAVRQYSHEAFDFIGTSGDKYTVHCHTTDTRQGFCHTAELCDEVGRVITTAKRSYLNRTWERFQYESVLFAVVEKAFPGKKCEQERSFFRTQIDGIANHIAQSAEEWLAQFEKRYDQLSESTKEHTAKGLVGVTLETQEQAEEVLEMAEMFDAIQKLFA